MKYVIEERFIDDLGFTFEKAHTGGRGKPLEFMYIMRHSENVFELLDEERYGIAMEQWREDRRRDINLATQMGELESVAAEPFASGLISEGE
jgi:hypothetical protein